MAKPITIDLTFGQAVELVETLKSVHADSDWSVERALKGDLADLKGNDYVLRSADSQIAKRVRTAALITLITGEPYGDTTEVARLEEIRQAVEAYTPQPELEDA